MSDLAATPTLRDAHVALEALHPSHQDDLRHAVGDLWQLWYTAIPSPGAMAEEIQRRLSLQESGVMAPWAVVNPTTGRAVGMTTYMNIDATNRRVEIGSTWLGVQAQGTGINPAAKLLLLQRAFDDLDCIAVEFRTHWHNRQSREAIARLGAKQDGILRHHSVLPDGSLRDTVVFSIIRDEWPAVRAGLQYRLARYGSAVEGNPATTRAD